VSFFGLEKDYQTGTERGYVVPACLGSILISVNQHRSWDLLDQAGIGLLYLPRYSPEFKPIEHAWAKVKERLKAKAARTLEALEAELKPALDTITAKKMPKAGSGMPVMPYTDPKSALMIRI
jgi:transposase